jgi:dolichol-phosphate mannosyltransferase
VKITVLLPTSNERENIGLLIDALQRVFNAVPHDMCILVIDDNSPDGTAEIVQKAMERFSNVYLTSGEKQGLGAAYIRGIMYALEILQAEAVLEMEPTFLISRKTSRA